jgi:hypothetical protein
MNVEDVTPAIFLRNEAYWVYYVVRDLLKVFGRLVVLDTGSDDSTPDLIRMAAEEIGGTLTMRLERYGNDSRLIGNAPNVLRQMVGTEWMLLCGGDEIWCEEQLTVILASDIPEGCTIGMVCGRNVEDVDGQLVERDRFSADRLIGRGVAWNGDYPFESHGLERRIRAGEVHYLDGNAAYYWHVRHLERSPQDWVTFYRDRKQNFFPWNGDRVPLPDTWLGEVRDDIPNPYLIPTPAGG